MIDPSLDVLSCDQILDYLSADYPVQHQSLIFVESFLRSFEVRKYLADEFRRSRRSELWIANSKTEVDPKTYLEIAKIFNHIAECLGDLRFVNASLKILDNKGDSKQIRTDCIQRTSKIIHA